MKGRLLALTLLFAPFAAGALVTREVEAVSVTTVSVDRVVWDFGLEAFGWAEARGEGVKSFRLGELLAKDGGVDMKPGATIRAAESTLALTGDFRRIPLKADRRNTTGGGEGRAVEIPGEYGVVMPFRYVETAAGVEVRQIALEHPMDRSAATFTCDDPGLVKVWEFCKHSIIATSFAGMYVDGDRERIPYESDAYINQLGEYAVHAGPSLAGKTHEYLLDHPTWPTEWRQHSIKMAWADWMRTGETQSIARAYAKLKDRLLLKHAREDALIVSGGERRRNGRMNSRGLADIVDWPEGERDGFVFRDVNAVVNAFHYSNLLEMRDIARALGKDEDASWYQERAKKAYGSFQKVFFDHGSGLYTDGEGTRHSSLHANAAALAFDLVPEEKVSKVADFCVSRGMASSPYFAQYVLEGLFKAGRDEAAIALMASKGERSWLGMMDFGATITMEAWSKKAKANLDMNHAWGAAPVNIISRYVLGVRPLEPGYAKYEVRPQTGRLKYVEGIVPTPAGPVKVKVVDGVTISPQGK